MKILYIASIRLPTEKAHGIQIMKTCEAISRQGIDIELFVPGFLNTDPVVNDPFDYYRVQRIFNIQRLVSLRLIRLGPIGFFLETFIFFLSMLFSKGFWTSDYIFSRDEMLVYLSALLGKKTIWETHTGSYNFFAKGALEMAELIVSITQGLKDFYISKAGPNSRIIVSPDGVDVDEFEISITQDEARKASGLPEDKKIALYAGRLDGWKGFRTFLDSSLLFNDDVIAIVIGGDLAQVESLKKEYPKAMFLGYKPYTELPIYQKSADVLVIPNSANSDVSRLYTSPLKIFSSMASGVPIVASDLPSIREVLNETNSVLVLPDNPETLWDGIRLVLEDKNKADIMSRQALSDVARYSWTERSKTIISSLNR